MSNNENRANELASELKGLPTETVEASVRSETARVEVAVCVRAVRRRTAMARPRQGMLGGGKASTEVSRLISSWSKG